MIGDWFDAVAAGDFLPEVSDALRAEIDAAGETVAYAQGYADGVGLAVERIRAARWSGYAEGVADASAPLDGAAGPCLAPLTRPRPMHGRRPRSQQRQD